MEKYYFKFEYGQCIERCKVRNDGTMLGSISCQECPNCIDVDENKEWISCCVIDKAK